MKKNRSILIGWEQCSSSVTPVQKVQHRCKKCNSGLWFSQMRKNGFKKDLPALPPKPLGHAASHCLALLFPSYFACRHTTPREFGNVVFTLKKHQMFSVYTTPEKFESATIAGDFWIGLLQQTITWHKIRHAGGQTHYYSRTETLKQRPVKLDWLRSLCFNVPVRE